MQSEHPLRIHCSISPGESFRDTAAFLSICRQAEAAGIESVQVPVATSLSNALKLAVFGGSETACVRFRIASDFDRILASLTGRELKQAWQSLGARLILHISFGDELPARNESFLAAGEFIANCRNLFDKSEGPQFDVQGDSSGAAFLAIKHADLLWRRPHRPSQVYADALPVLHFGKEVGLLCFVIARESREQAMEFGRAHLSENSIEQISNPASWITPDLLTDISPVDGDNNPIFVGSFDRVARAICSYKKSGISQVILREWPIQQSMPCFAQNLLPLIRVIESGKVAS